MARTYFMTAGYVASPDGRAVDNGSTVTIRLTDAEAGTVVPAANLRRADGTAWPAEGVSTDEDAKIIVQVPGSGPFPDRLYADTGRARWEMLPVDLSARVTDLEDNPAGLTDDQAAVVAAAARVINGILVDPDGDPIPVGATVADVSLPAMIAAGAATVNMDAYDGSNGAIVITVGGKSVALIAANGAAGADGGTPPGQVAKPTATSSAPQTVTLSWAAPGVAGTNPISMYGGEFRVHGATSTTPLVFTGTSTGATLPDMPVASLEFHVRAGSVSGWGAWSAWSDPVDVQDAPAGSWDYNFVQMYADGDTTLPSRFTVENGQPFVITSTGLKCPTAGFNGNGILTTLATPGYGTLEVTYQNKAGLSLTMRRGPHSAPIQALTIDDTGWYEYIDALYPPDVTHSIGTGGPDSTFAIVSHPAADGAKAHDWCEFFKGGLKVGEYVGTTGEGYLDAAMGLQNPAGTVTRLKFTAA